jgi:hypothetical protein
MRCETILCACFDDNGRIIGLANPDMACRHGCGVRGENVTTVYGLAKGKNRIMPRKTQYPVPARKRATRSHPLMRVRR